ncbi:MAG: DUF1015 domain-containing protein, partial [Flavobacteriales bacterium]
VDKLDAELLSKTILEPILDIQDIKNDKRVEFFSDLESKSSIETKLETEKNAIAFFLKPVDINLLKEIADKELIMPPKSTYIEPKLRSGLIIYEY